MDWSLLAPVAPGPEVWTEPKLVGGAEDDEMEVTAGPREPASAADRSSSALISPKRFVDDAPYSPRDIVGGWPAV